MRSQDRRCWIVALEDLLELSEYKLRRRSSETVPGAERLLDQLQQGCLRLETVLDLESGFALVAVTGGTTVLSVKCLEVR